MKIVRTDAELQVPAVDRSLRLAGHQVVLLPDGIGEPALIEAVRDAELLLMCYTPVTAAVLAAAPRLRGIVKYGVGIDAIDIAAARARGIVVVNVPDYAEQTVAEGAFALMLALFRKLVPLDRQMQHDGWVWPEPRWLGGDIAGKTIGIIGLGKIGRSFARIAGQGFRAKVVACDPHVAVGTMHDLGIEKAETLWQLLPNCDVVSLHCVLNEQTRHLIGDVELRLMKKAAVLINTARGALVDEPALVRALQENRIAGAGLDVFSMEPLSRQDHPLSALFGMPNVVLMPHLTFYTEDAMRRLERETLERCFEIIEGRPVVIKSDDPRLQGQAMARP